MGALVFFVLSLIFSIDAIVATQVRESVDDTELLWSEPRRVVVGLTLGSFSALLLYHHFRASQRISEMVTRHGFKARILQDAAVVIAWTVFIVVTVLGNGERTWLWSGAPVTLLAGSVAVGLTTVRLRREQDTGRTAAWLVAVLGALLVLWSTGAISSSWEEHQLGIAVAAVLSTLLPNVVGTTATLMRRLAAHRLASS